jgi:hypothetical protein
MSRSDRREFSKASAGFGLGRAGYEIPAGYLRSWIGDVAWSRIAPRGVLRSRLVRARE